MDANGDLFGTTDPSTQAGGNSGGVVFEIVRTSTAYEFTPTIVADFDGLADGSLGANLVADANGNLFGTTQAGGLVNNKGSAFEITNSGYAPDAFGDAKNRQHLVAEHDGQAAIWQMNGTDVVGAGLGRRQSWAGLESGRDGRLQRRRQFRHPVAEHQRPGCDLGNGRDQPDRRRQ